MLFYSLFILFCYILYSSCSSPVSFSSIRSVMDLHEVSLIDSLLHSLNKRIRVDNFHNGTVIFEDLISNSSVSLPVFETNSPRNFTPPLLVPPPSSPDPLHPVSPPPLHPVPPPPSSSKIPISQSSVDKKVSKDVPLFVNSTSSLISSPSSHNSSSLDSSPLDSSVPSFSNSSDSSVVPNIPVRISPSSPPPSAIFSNSTTTTPSTFFSSSSFDFSNDLNGLIDDFDFSSSFFFDAFPSSDSFDLLFDSFFTDDDFFSFY
mmetsp:Transcript_13966/g.21138  ORF Transcript_13966/g.21138 Transcript_13966/m.21138 type:complete len:260 (+) Transcript_13966:1162-1941(+)